MSNTQKNFERESHRLAINKMVYDDQKAKNKSYYSSTPQAQQTIKCWALPLAEQLVEFVNKHKDGRASVKASPVACPEIFEWLKIVEPNILSVILLKTILDAHGVHQKLTLPRLAQMIGTRFEDEARFRFYEITAPEDVVAAAWKRVSAAGSSPRYRRLSTKIITEKMLDEKGFDESAKWKRWTDHYRLTLGLSLVEFCFSLGLITKTIARRGKKTTAYVDLSPETKRIQETIFNEMKEISYFAYPLIEPPLHWLPQAGEARDNTSGGFHTDFIREQTALCRGRYYKSEFGHKTLDFVNLLGDVRLSLFPKTIDLAQRCLDKGWTIGSLRAVFRHPALDEPMPLYLQELPTDNPERISWRREMKEIYENFEKQRRNSIRSRQALSMARDFLHRDKFYLSWSCDYRGRCYSEQPWLNPQTTDVEKSFLTFTDAEPLTDKGELWAAQAVGAAYLGSTKAFADRTSWTYNNKELIKAIASNPLETLSLWEDCKEPWTFVQLAIEWNDVVLEGNKKEWSVPVGADATASGLQLLSSMLRDPVGMKFSNVLPPEQAYDAPQDSYIAVLDLARHSASQTPETAHLVPFMVHRNIGKTTMVHLYGASHGTIRDRIIKVFVKLNQFGDNNQVSWKDCDAMAYLVEAAAKVVFPRAYDALAWLKKLGSIAAKKGLHEFKWFVPTGDLVNLQKFQSNSVRINTSHLGKITIPTGRTKELDVRGMKAALAPDFIHSYDASLLKLSFAGWTKPLAVIHDCVRIHPNDVDDAHAAIRKAFIEVCSGDPLARLADDIGITEDELPRLKQDNQDLDVVLNSPYLFN